MDARCLAVFLVFLCWQGLGSVRAASAVQDTCPSSDKTCIWVKWKSYKVVINATVGQEPHIYCLRSVQGIWLRLKSIWTKYKVSLVVPKGGNLTLQLGNSSAAIRQVTQSTLWKTLWLESKEEKCGRLYLSPYESACVGVSSLKGNRAHEYQIVFRQEVSLFHLLLFMVGALLYVKAPRLCRNMAFYYAGGVFIGVVASVLILLYFFSKVIPKKNLMGLGVVIGGWSLVGYLVSWFFSQGWEFVLENWIFVCVYITLSGLISFGTLYRIGPAHYRTLQLLQWSTQLLALLMVACAFQTWGASLLAVAMLLAWYNVPVAVSTPLASILCYIFFWFKPFWNLFKKHTKKKLLTLEEYEQEGRVGTEAALNELQDYCRQSRMFWKTKLNKLEDKQRFMNFMAGQDHVSEEERDEHWKEFGCAFYSSSEEDSSDEVTPPNATPAHHSFHSTDSSLSSPSLTPSPSPRKHHSQHPHYD